MILPPDYLKYPSTRCIYAPFPSVFITEDGYSPESAQLIVEVAAEQTDGTHALLWALAGMKASGEWSRN